MSCGRQHCAVLTYVLVKVAVMTVKALITLRMMQKIWIRALTRKSRLAVNYFKIQDPKFILVMYEGGSLEACVNMKHAISC